MKPYGMKLIEFINDSKKAGDCSNSNAGNAVYSSTGSRNYLRRYKKAARRSLRADMLSYLAE
jgi:hypothetical protein